VVYELNPLDLKRLDELEGLGKGYGKHEVDVLGVDGTVHRAWMYYVDDPKSVTTERRPYAWYLRHVVEGARHHGLPTDYIERLERTPTNRDGREERWRREISFPCDAVMDDCPD
jgi:gamma-glutamylcyclotransferase